MRREPAHGGGGPETPGIRVQVNPASDDCSDDISVPLLERGVRAVLAREEIPEAEISLTLLDDSGIQDLNRRYLDRPRPTDVIAFPLFEPDEPVVGDVYVGVEQARRQAVELDLPVDEELLRLAIHGTLHVLGYDHPEDGERESSRMYRIQEELVDRLMTDSRGPGSSGPRPSGPRSSEEGT